MIKRKWKLRLLGNQESGKFYKSDNSWDVQWNFEKLATLIIILFLSNAFFVP